MYISGHLDILEDLVHNNLPRDYFELPFKKFNVDELKKGIQYVDAPCGKFGIKNNSVYVYRRRVCEITNLSKLFFENDFGESKIFQFHKGFFAHLHAMTTDPDNSVRKIRDKIIVSVLGYSLLAYYDGNIFDSDPKVLPNAMWAGMVLHIITDSYSPAHTMRSPKLKYNTMQAKNIIGNDKKMRLIVHETIKTIAKQPKLLGYDYFLDEVKSACPAASHVFIDHKAKQLYKIYEVFKFEYDTNRMVDTMISRWKNIPQYSGKEVDGDIVAFQYYDEQPAILHMRLDQLQYTRNNKKLYERMIAECKQYMLLYKKVLMDGDVTAYLDAVLRLMVDGTFRIHKRYLADKTNKIVSDY